MPRSVSTKSSIIASLAVILAVAVLTGCGKPTDNNTLKIGAVLFQTNNDYANVAQDFSRGFELALEKADIPVEFTLEDDSLDLKKTVAATRKLIAVDHVDALLIPMTYEAKPVAPIIEEANIPALTYWESSPVIEGLGKNWFGIGLWQPDTGAGPARFAKNNLQAKTAAIVYDKNEWAEAVRGFFRDEFERQGGKVIFEEGVLNDIKDFRSTIIKMKQVGADVLFAPLGFHPDIFFRQLREVGYDKPKLASDSTTPEFIQAAAGGFEGVYYSNVDDAVTPELAKLLESYRKKYGTDPGSIHWVGLAHDALSIVVDAWKRRGSGSLRDAIAGTKDFVGVFGRTALDANGSFPRPEVMYVVENGKSKRVE